MEQKDIDEVALRAQLKQLKKEIAEKNSRIDSELDRMAFGHDVENKDELYEEQEELLKNHEVLRNLEDELDDIDIKINNSKQIISELVLRKKELLTKIEDKINEINKIR